MTGVNVQPMIDEGVEAIVGVTLDPAFGPLIMFGLGGIFVELLQDVTFRLHPITDLDAAEMVRELKAHKLLDGYRSHPPADVAAVQELLLRVSALIEAVPEIREMDFNPVKLLRPGHGATVVDARIRLQSV